MQVLVPRQKLALLFERVSAIFIAKRHAVYSPIFVYGDGEKERMSSESSR